MDDIKAIELLRGIPFPDAQKAKEETLASKVAQYRAAFQKVLDKIQDAIKNSRNSIEIDENSITKGMLTLLEEKGYEVVYRNVTKTVGTGNIPVQIFYYTISWN
jgi:phosphoenolpyruvate-protein kinase (PTS system EI component)